MLTDELREFLVPRGRLRVRLRPAHSSRRRVPEDRRCLTDNHRLLVRHGFFQELGELRLIKISGIEQVDAPPIDYVVAGVPAHEVGTTQSGRSRVPYRRNIVEVCLVDSLHGPAKGLDKQTWI